MARSAIYPAAQTDGDLVAPWSFPFSGFGHLNLEEAGGWITTDGTDTTSHSAQVSHGITTTGDWQFSALLDCTTAGTAEFGALICSTGYTGYWVILSNLTVRVRAVVGGAPSTVIVSATRNAASLVPAFVECTYTASTDTFELFEDGVSRGTGTNATHEAVDKQLLIPIASQFGGARSRARDLYIQDTIAVLGRPPRPALPPIPAQRYRRTLLRSR